MKLSEKQLVLLSVALSAAVVAVTVAALALRRPAPLPAAGTGYVALIRIEGAIAYQTSQLSLLGSTASADDLVQLLDAALKDPLAKAVVLRVNSPGGSAAASEALYLKVRELAASKPVVAYIEEYGTSGAYMAVLPAARILAANSSIVGSVGVYTSVITYSGLLEKLGVRVYVFKSGELKDVGSSFREPSEEDKRVLQSIVDGIFELFKKRVLAHRRLANASEVFSGRPFLAEEAVKLGLIDGIGTLDDAVNLAREMAGLPKDAPVRELKPPSPGLLRLLLGAASLARRPVAPSVEVLAMWPPPG
ncbi:MAG: signal peptide peptidase SppA [Thermofilum sp.]|nr:signal peptide peptidase SppA [Thermofilum sp.]